MTQQADRIQCSRKVYSKTDAFVIANMFRRHGGIEVKINQEGVAFVWIVRAKMTTLQLAKFCSEEARKESATP